MAANKTGVADLMALSMATMSSSNAAGAVLTLIDDPSCDNDRLARAISGDAALAGRVIALANSAYYGVSGLVGNVQRAVSVIGFGHVRSMAALAAAGVGGGGWDGFITHAAFLASASNQLAGQFGVRKLDAFSAGLLCDVGLYLFSQADPEAAAALREANDLDAERENFGIDHTELAAKLLTHWKFPDHLIEAVAAHHSGAGETMAGVLAAADALRTGDDATLTRLGVTGAGDIFSVAWNEVAAISSGLGGR